MSVPSDFYEFQRWQSCVTLVILVFAFGFFSLRTNKKPPNQKETKPLNTVVVSAKPKVTCNDIFDYKIYIKSLNSFIGHGNYSVIKGHGYGKLTGVYKV